VLVHEPCDGQDKRDESRSSQYASNDGADICFVGVIVVIIRVIFARVTCCIGNLQT
jgi:hypothetical protein